MTLFLNILQIGGLLLLVLVIFNLIIIVHELGHFLAARWRKMKVERFAIWFGSPIWKKTFNGVEYRLGTIPAGGYVMLPQMASMESIEGKTHADKEQLPPVSPLDKIIVAVAGPLFSLMLAVVFAFIVWGVGRAVPEAEGTTTIGWVVPGGPAEAAGLKPGDEILRIDGNKIKQFGGMVDSVIWSVVSSRGETIAFDIKRDGTEQTLHATPRIEERKGLGRGNLREVGISGKATPVVVEVDEASVFAKAGIQKGDWITHADGAEMLTHTRLVEALTGDPSRTAKLTVLRHEKGGATRSFEAGIPVQPPLVVGVTQDSPASEAGLKPGDKIIAVQGQVPASSAAIVKVIQASDGQSVPLTIERAGKREELAVTPRKTTAGSIRIGIAFGQVEGLDFLGGGPITHVRQNPIEQIAICVRGMGNTLGALFAPKSSIKVEQLSGPVGIISHYLLALMSPEGLRYALWFSVFLNVNLAILNMMPFPVLDGGHIVLSLFEMIRRRPLNVKIVEALQTGFALLLFGLFFFLTFKDVLDIPKWFGFERSSEQMEFTKPSAKKTG